MRHIEVHEVRRGDEPPHSGAVIEAVRAPERRHHVAEVHRRQAAPHAQSVGCVAGGAGGHVDRTPAFRVGGVGELGHLAHSEPGQLLPRGHAGREELDVGQDGLHRLRIRRDGAPVHAALHAAIHALLQRDPGTRARVVARVFSEEAEQRNSELLCSRLEMAISAGEIVAGIAVGGIRHFRADIGIGGGNEITTAPDQAAVRVLRQSAHFRHGPDGRLRGGHTFAVRRTRRGTRPLRGHCNASKEKDTDASEDRYHCANLAWWNVTAEPPITLIGLILWCISPDSAIRPSV